MKGLSESVWQNSDNFKDFSISAVSDRSPYLFSSSRIRSSNDASHDSGYMPRVKGRDRVVLAHRDLHRNKFGLPGVHENEVANSVSCAIKWRDISLRKWLDNPERVVDASQCLYIFRQIVEIVKVAHSQGIVVHNVCPSCFVISSLNRVSFTEAASCLDLNSGSMKDRSNSQMAEVKGPSSPLPRSVHRKPSLLEAGNCRLEVNQKNSSLLGIEVGSSIKRAQEKKHPSSMKHIVLLEAPWYTSPEESTGAQSSFASDIYKLGIVLFELYCTFRSAEEKSSIMSNLGHRVLPPQLLLKWPNEASCCLWLLHPDPSGRPKMSELLQSEYLNAQKDDIDDHEAARELQEEIDEQELLLDFLVVMQKGKKETADNLIDTVSCLSSDIEEIANQLSILQRNAGSCSQLDQSSVSGFPIVEEVGKDDCSFTVSRKRYRPGLQNPSTEESDDCPQGGQTTEAPAENDGRVFSKCSLLTKDFRKLESAYLSTRWRVIEPADRSTQQSPVSRFPRGSTAVNERSSVNYLPLEDRSSWTNTFLEGLGKYLSFSKLKVKADLKLGDLLNSSNLVCSLSFDRDGEFFATAGVNKKIKVFEYGTIVNADQDIHCPLVELASRSKLSNICWNGYIKSQIASSNFDGVVQVWDVTRSQVLLEMREHERRVWSVDFSLADPTMLASGSDDGSVKLWNIKQGISAGTIKTKANVCCVQFHPNSGHSLAFGSADHRIYYYDLRNSRVPLCTMIGHSKTVSYVKFIDSTNIVSASTDNTLKLWDLSICASRVIDSPLQSFTGHTNVKNFVGLSVSDGYIATGSETNEVFIYHKALPMPVLSFKFSSTDPLSGKEIDDPTQFISAICWQSHSPTLVAANSIGNIKVLEMV